MEKMTQNTLMEQKVVICVVGGDANSCCFACCVCSSLANFPDENRGFLNGQLNPGKLVVCSFYRQHLLGNLSELLFSLGVPRVIPPAISHVRF